jgi:hypothetical protein
VCRVIRLLRAVLTEWRREKEKDGNGWTADDGWNNRRVPPPLMRSTREKDERLFLVSSYIGEKMKTCRH